MIILKKYVVQLCSEADAAISLDQKVELGNPFAKAPEVASPIKGKTLRDTFFDEDAHNKSLMRDQMFSGIV